MHMKKIPDQDLLCPIVIKRIIQSKSMTLSDGKTYYTCPFKTFQFDLDLHEIRVLDRFANTSALTNIEQPPETV